MLGIASATLIASGVLSSVIGPIFSVVALGSALIAGKTSMNILENQQAQARLSTRIANLKNDLSIIENNARRKIKKTPEILNKKKKISDSKAKHITPDNEELIDDYIKNLENTSGKNIPLQKVKR